MVRVQIQLDEEQRQALRERAHRERRSEAAVVRDALDRYLRDGPDDRRRKMLEALDHAGKHRSGCSDVSARHDEYLAEAIAGQR